jgi:predicted transcriptional regulator of viral defense system
VLEKAPQWGQIQHAVVVVAERIDKAIAALARKQHGYVTRRQLLDLGLGRRAIRYRVEVGRLIAVYAGVYAVGHIPLGQEARAHAAVLACGDGTVLSHQSAAALWKYVKDWPTRIEVTAPTDRHRRGITAHRTKTLTRRDIARQLGVPITSPARTVFDMAPRYKTDAALRRFVNDARLTYTLHLSSLAELLARHPRQPATKRLMQFVDKPTGMTRSELEDLFVDFARRYGLPQPTINKRKRRREPDILFPEEGVIVEIDSWKFHGDRGSFERDRDRDADNLADGLLTVRVTEERLTGSPGREAARLLKVLEQARRRAA